MRLPPFLQFLSPLYQAPKDRFGLEGHILVERQARGGPRVLVHESKNYIVDAGKTGVRDLLLGNAGGGFYGSVFRMAIGDGGTPAGELYNPYLPDSTWAAKTALFHELIRQDIDAFSAPTDFSARFVAAFNSTDLVGHDSSYSRTTKVANEACLIIGDGVLTIGGDKKFLNDGESADADEVMMSMRTFNSASFDNTEDVTVTITWTITVVGQS